MYLEKEKRENCSFKTSQLHLTQILPFLETNDFVFVSEYLMTQSYGHDMLMDHVICQLTVQVESCAWPTEPLLLLVCWWQGPIGAGTGAGGGRSWWHWCLPDHPSEAPPPQPMHQSSSSPVLANLCLGCIQPAAGNLQGKVACQGEEQVEPFSLTSSFLCSGDVEDNRRGFCPLGPYVQLQI